MREKSNLVNVKLICKLHIHTNTSPSAVPLSSSLRPISNEFFFLLSNHFFLFAAFTLSTIFLYSTCVSLSVDSSIRVVDVGGLFSSSCFFLPYFWCCYRCFSCRWAEFTSVHSQSALCCCFFHVLCVIQFCYYIFCLFHWNFSVAWISMLSI